MMRDIISRGDAERLQTAMDWLMRMRDATAREEDIVRWVQWCESDARNQLAFDQVQDLWRLSKGLAGEVTDGEFAVERGRALSSDNGWSLKSLLRTYWPAMALASLATLAVSVYFLRPPKPQELSLSVPPAAPVHATTLSDGSKVELAAKSEIAVHYTEHRRGLELRNGEAYFAVAPNAQRPFVVAVDRLRIRAVGTAFNIRRADERVVVTVSEGSVDVYRSNASPEDAIIESGASMSHRVRVAAGNQVTWSVNEADPVVAAVDPAAALEWREGRLQYTNEPLSAIIADLNRYSTRPVVIRDEAVKHLRFSGTLLTHSTAEWLHALPAEFPVEIGEQDGTDVILAR